MIEIRNIKLKVDYTPSDLEHKIKKILRLSYVPDYSLARISIDSRKKNNVIYVATVNVTLPNEEAILKKLHDANVRALAPATPYEIKMGSGVMHHRPILVGTGPAGLFAGLKLAQYGYKPIIFERGMEVERRKALVESFWNGESALNPNTNVQFGEGGAGTFSDGKLNTGVKNKYGFNREVLETFVKYGAPAEILITNKPHIGTDVLATVVKNMRDDIIKMGGEVHFESTVTDIELPGENEVLVTVNGETYTTNALVLAIGHSARDTFDMLYKKGVPMEQKPFAMGVRVEHPRRFIDISQYGDDPRYEKLLPAADYKLTHRAPNGRSVYSFCMCPGGYVVNASSEEGRMCVNGMSYSSRDGANSNSAIVTSITPKDFGSEHPLAGVRLQRSIEEAAYKACGGKVPVQMYGDFKLKEKSEKIGHITPAIKGEYALSNVAAALPDFMYESIISGMEAFDKIIPGFAGDDVVVSGVEARTSSPVKIPRSEMMNVTGTCIYPCGEGAGYAGGITSAAMDGIGVAKAIMEKYSNERL